MNPLGKHTPITLHGLRRGTHHPVLVAARLSTLAPHMSQADQLTFAITATLPRPPPGYRSEHEQPGRQRRTHMAAARLLTNPTSLYPQAA